jgi:hypothetical protein
VRIKRSTSKHRGRIRDEISQTLRKAKGIRKKKNALGRIERVTSKTEFGGHSVPLSHLRTHYLKLVGIKDSEHCLQLNIYHRSVR